MMPMPTPAVAFPLGLGNMETPVLPEQLLDLQKKYDMTQSSASDFCKSSNPEIIANAQVTQSFSQMKAANFRLRRPCHQLGLCKGRHREHWLEILGLHLCLQNALGQMLSDIAL